MGETVTLSGFTELRAPFSVQNSFPICPPSFSSSTVQLEYSKRFYYSYLKLLVYLENPNFQSFFKNKILFNLNIFLAKKCISF